LAAIRNSGLGRRHWRAPQAHPDYGQPDAHHTHHDVQEIDNDLKELQAVRAPVSPPGDARSTAIAAAALVGEAA
jgi:hypothetical protein